VARRRRSRGRWPTALGAALAAVTAGAVAAVVLADQRSEGQEGDLAFGQTVVVDARVSRLVGPHTLTVSGPDVGHAPVLVVGSALPPLQEGGGMHVTGLLGRCPPGSAERRLGVDLSDDERPRFDGAPCIWATSVAASEPTS
jgi:hypothetical protein